MVVSIDPRRVYLKDPNDVEFKSVRVSKPGKWASLLSLSLFRPLAFYFTTQIYVYFA